MLKSDPCIYGATTSHTSVVLFGDSHAAAWFPALDLISKQQHWRLVIFTKDVVPTAGGRDPIARDAESRLSAVEGRRLRTASRSCTPLWWSWQAPGTP